MTLALSLASTRLWCLHMATAAAIIAAVSDLRDDGRGNPGAVRALRLAVRRASV
jgi:hypothetical protein